MSEFHFRRPEKMIGEPAELLEIIAGQQIMTLALCKDNQPYLVTLDYVYDTARGCFYFHSAGNGRKIEYLRANPAVWGQVLEDHGYLSGRCEHAYRTVHFAGRVQLVEVVEEKRHALALMIERFEADPEPLRARLLAPHRVEAVTVGRIDVSEMTGKRNHTD